MPQRGTVIDFQREILKRAKPGDHMAFAFQHHLGQCRKDNLFARFGQRLGHLVIMLFEERGAFGTDHFAQIDIIHRRIRNPLIKGQLVFGAPVKQDRRHCQFAHCYRHVLLLNAPCVSFCPSVRASRSLICGSCPAMMLSTALR